MRTALRIGALLLIASSAVLADEELRSRFSRDTLIVVSSAHACYVFDIYLALDYEQKRRGLMFVRELPERTGMLFVYDDIDYHSMWMKNTFIPLDMVFIRSDGPTPTR